MHHQTTDYSVPVQTESKTSISCCTCRFFWLQDTSAAIYLVNNVPESLPLWNGICELTEHVRQRSLHNSTWYSNCDHHGKLAGQCWILLRISFINLTLHNNVIHTFMLVLINLCLVPCSRLSRLYVTFWMNVKFIVLCHAYNTKVPLSRHYEISWDFPDFLRPSSLWRSYPHHAY